jgi:cytochrome oxidase assembly protein ShyY1
VGGPSATGPQPAAGTLRSMRSDLLRPRALLGHLLVLAVAATCVALGFWQLDRLGQVRDHNARLAERMEADPVDLGALVTAGDLDAAELEFRTAEVTGTFRPEEEVLQRGQQDPRGQQGFHVLTPLDLGDGTAVLVRRGWVPTGLDTPPVAEAAPPAGEVTVTGLLERSVPQPGFGPQDAPDGRLERVFHPDTDRLDRQVSGDLLPVVLRLDADTIGTDGRVPGPARTAGVGRSEPPVLRGAVVHLRRARPRDLRRVADPPAAPTRRPSPGRGPARSDPSRSPHVTVDDDGGAPSFADLDLRPELVGALNALGYEEPTPIQREAIPPLLAGRDLLGQAATGTGKTAAFALPLLQRLPAGDRGTRPNALVLVPTRELAMQVSQAIHRYGKDLGARVLPIYGGQPIGRQLKALDRGVDVVVATPGRASTTSAAARSCSTSSRSSCSTRPTRCSTWASRRTSRGSSPRPPSTARRCCSRPRCPAHRQARPEAPARPGADHPLPRGGGHRGLAPDPSGRLRRRPAHKPAALGRVLDVEAPEAAIVFCRTRTRSTSSPRP